MAGALLLDYPRENAMFYVSIGRSYQVAKLFHSRINFDQTQKGCDLGILHFELLNSLGLIIFYIFGR